MRYISRALVLLFVVPATFCFGYFVSSLLSMFFPFLIKQQWIANFTSLLCAVGVGCYVWNKLDSTPDDLILSILLGGIVLGAIGSCVGPFLPFIFPPLRGNLGPLIGILLMGPLGFLLGAIGGYRSWRIHNKKKENE